MTYKIGYGQASFLDLSFRSLTDQNLPELLSSLKSSPTVTQLKISGNRFSLGGLQALVKELPHLRALDISFNYPRPFASGIKALLNAIPQNSKLASLQAWGAGVSSRGEEIILGQVEQNKVLGKKELVEVDLGFDSPKLRASLNPNRDLQYKQRLTARAVQQELQQDIHSKPIPALTFGFNPKGTSLKPAIAEEQRKNRRTNVLT